MFSIGKSIAPGFTAPTVKVRTEERKVEYNPRTYSQFIKGLRKNEFPSVTVRPNKHIAIFHLYPPFYLHVESDGTPNKTRQITSKSL